MKKKEAEKDNLGTVAITAKIVAAYVSNNIIAGDKIPSLLCDVHGAILDFVENGTTFDRNRTPAVAITKSITPDYLICLEDGRKLKMLKRYLRTHYNLSPEEYRRKWGLPADYPIVAPNYSKRRSRFAKEIGLGMSSAKRKQKTTKNKKAPRQS